MGNSVSSVRTSVPTVQSLQQTTNREESKAVAGSGETAVSVQAVKNRRGFLRTLFSRGTKVAPVAVAAPTTVVATKAGFDIGGRGGRGVTLDKEERKTAAVSTTAPAKTVFEISDMLDEYGRTYHGVALGTTLEARRQDRRDKVRAVIDELLTKKLAGKSLELLVNLTRDDYTQLISNPDAYMEVELKRLNDEYGEQIEQQLRKLEYDPGRVIEAINRRVFNRVVKAIRNIGQA